LIRRYKEGQFSRSSDCISEKLLGKLQGQLFFELIVRASPAWSEEPDPRYA
jgi:hypothetical protein